MSYQRASLPFRNRDSAACSRLSSQIKPKEDRECRVTPRTDFSPGPALFYASTSAMIILRRARIIFRKLLLQRARGIFGALLKLFSEHVGTLTTFAVTLYRSQRIPEQVEEGYRAESFGLGGFRDPSFFLFFFFFLSFRKKSFHRVYCYLQPLIGTPRETLLGYHL